MKEKILSCYLGEAGIQSRVSNFIDSITYGLKQMNIYSDLVLAGMIATIRVELGRSYILRAEINGEKQWYSPYYGRGAIQLTLKSNYDYYSYLLGVDLYNNGNSPLLFYLELNARLIILYFVINGLIPLCNQKRWLEVRKRINGVNRQTGFPNGWEEYKRVLTDFGVF